MDVFYTTSESIRASLGVTVREIADSQLTDLNLAIQIELDLDDVYPDHATAKTAAEGVTPTAEETKIYRLIQMYCQYQGAVLMLPGLQNFIPQKLSDSGFEMQRFSKDDIDKTKTEIIGLRDKYKLALEALLDSTATAPPSVIMVSTPSFDPVTNEGA